MNTNNDVKWRRFIVPKKVEQINDHLFIDTYKSNNIKIGVNDVTVNDSEMSVVLNLFTSIGLCVVCLGSLGYGLHK